MKLTTKDRDFLETLKRLLEEKQLAIEFKEDGLKRMVLRQNYGDKIARYFGMSRQGVRWRFQRLFNEVYVEAYLRLYWLESNFGTELRHYALAIAGQRIEHYRKAQKLRQVPSPRRESASRPSNTRR